MLKRSAKKLTNENEAYNYALDLISFRDYSVKNMENCLKRRGAEENVIKSTITKLLEYDFLNEKRYAHRIFEAWFSKRYYGRNHLRMELQKKNVSEKYWTEIMNLLNEDIENERAQVALRLCFKRNCEKYNPQTREGLSAIGRFLYARGFTGKQIQRTINSIQDIDVITQED